MRFRRRTAAVDAQPGASSSSETPPLEVLVADDDAHDQMLFGMAAEESGKQMVLEFVNDGAELVGRLEALAAHDRLPSAVVLDLRMPRMDGHAVLGEIAERPHLKGLPVVVFSTSRRPQDVDACKRAGALSYVTKPNTYDELVAFVESIADIGMGARPSSPVAG